MSKSYMVYELHLNKKKRYQKQTKPKLPEAAVTGPGLGLALHPRHPELTSRQARAEAEA